MWEDHACLLIEVSENFVVSVALLKVLVSSLVAATNEVDTSILSGNGSGIERHFKLHLHWSLLKLLVVHFENVGIFLVPLE